MATKKKSARPVSAPRPGVISAYVALINNPKFREAQALLKEAFRSDFDGLCKFTASISLDLARLEFESRLLLKHLRLTGTYSQEILRLSNRPDMLPQYLTEALARTPNEPILLAAIAFYAGRSQERILNAKRAGRKGAEMKNKAKDFVVQEWQRKRNKFSNNKSKFARTYVVLIGNEFKDKKGDPLRVTERTIREEWLKDHPSAS